MNVELPTTVTAMLSFDKLRQQFKKILSLDAHPGHISAGFAVGVFISFTPPVPGLHTALALVVAVLFRLNKLTCLTGAWVNSPITIVPSMILSYKLGNMLMGGRHAELRVNSLDWASLKGVLIHHSAPLLLGCSIIGFLAAIASYFICYWLVVAVRRRDAALAEMTREMEVVGEELE